MQEPQERQVQSLGWKDPLEKEMAAHSSIPAGKIPWKEAPGGLHPRGIREPDTTEQLSTHTQTLKLRRLSKGQHCFLQSLPLKSFPTEAQMATIIQMAT